MIRRFTKFFDQARVWEEARKDNAYFLGKYRSELKHVKLGCSYSPEHVEWQEKQFKSQRSKIKITDQNLKLQLLQTVIREFNIKDIRFGLRWNSIDNGKRLDLTYYKPLLDTLFEKNISVTLNIGPIKTFRWPEQYVPDYVLRSITLPEKGDEISAESALAQHSYQYLHTLFALLTQTYSGKELSHIKTFQLENEPFHRFGVHEWRMSEAYMRTLMKITLQYFPHAQFLINSSEMRNVRKIADFYSSLISETPELRNRLVLGYNYFYNVPGERIIKGIGRVDSITQTKFSGRNICSKNLQWGTHIGYKTEVTEAQVEPWDPIITPGNDAGEFRFLLARSIENLIDCAMPSVIRLWGIEHLALRYWRNDLTNQHEQIIDLIQAINTQ